MATEIKTVLFSTLFPSAAQPRHGIFVENRLRALMRSGPVASKVLAPVPWFPSTNARFGRWSTWARTPRNENRHGIDVVHPRYVLPPKIGMNVAPALLALGARPVVREWLDAGFDFDLIDAHYYYPDGVAAAILGRWFRKPFIVTARGSDMNVLARFAVPSRWIRWAMSHASASIAVSDSLGRRMISMGEAPSKVHVLRNGVDREKFQPRDQRECRDLLNLGDGLWLVSVGNLVGSKGHDVAIGALKQLPAHVRLIIIGDGPQRHNLETQASELELSDRVLFVSNIPQDQLSDWYNAADICVLCSEMEGMPNVLLESIACGTPVVGTMTGGIPEIIGTPEVGRLMANRSASALAASVMDLITTKADRQAIRRHSRNFSWDNTTEGQLEIFRQAISDFKHAC